MLENLQSLWDDENFNVQTGVIPGRVTFSGADLGPGIIYYPDHVSLDHHLAGTIETVRSRRSPLAGLNFLWNTGSETEIFNPHEESSPFVRVALKPSPQLAAEIPPEFLGLASAALLQEDWAEPFKDSVRDDLDLIRAFIEPLSPGQAPDPESLERATLAKQDLDLKLLWSAGEYSRRGAFTLGYGTKRLASATPANGLINVTAHTVDAAKNPVQACEVRYVTVINSSNPGLYKTFSRFSTPTSESLSVGNYKMWAEKNGQMGPQRNVAVASVSTTQFVDLWAP